jgi:hypothetical protein
MHQPMANHTVRQTLTLLQLQDAALARLAAITAEAKPLTKKFKLKSRKAKRQRVDKKR